jgi:hypothetical protein
LVWFNHMRVTAWTAGVLESVDHPGVMLEVMVQDGPLNDKRSIHNGVLTPASGSVLSKKRKDQAPDQSV